MNDMASSTSFKSSDEPLEKRMTMTHRFRVCFCWWRMFHLKAGEPPEDVKRAFSDYSTNGKMSVEQLLEFLIKYQRENENEVTLQEAQAMVDSVRHLTIFHRSGLHLHSFFRYLLGEGRHNRPADQNGPLRSVDQDMNAPLAHYFIYTGHNSYLTGNQITSKSSTKPIINALKRGVRVIELDLWPNKTGDDAEVCHGGTWTAPVALIDCLKAIQKFAFHASEYPVVITFEDHLNSQLQAKVAKMVKEVFGEMLYYPDSTREQKQFPSPERLKRKVLISTKPPEYHEGKDDLSKEEFDEDLTEYRSLIAIHAGKPKGGVENWLASQSRVRRLSLSEQELEDFARTHGTEIVRFTQNNLLRIYPKSLRLDSSNYDPMIGWTHGAQMVAFNMQGLGKFLWIMDGLFRAYGRSGYVKKPDILLNVGSDNKVFDPSATYALPIRQILKVKVYTSEGWHVDFRGTDFDYYSPPDFFVKVGIYGVAADSTDMWKTKTINDHWIPVWDEEFEFPLRVPELALLRVEVRDYDLHGKHDFGGQTCLPVSLLKSGIRFVRLCDCQGQPYRSVRLLMGFRCDTPPFR